MCKQDGPENKEGSKGMCQEASCNRGNYKATITLDDGKQEAAATVGGDVEHGSGFPNIAVGWMTVEKGGLGGNTESKIKGLIK